MAVVLESGLEDRNYSVTLAGDGVQGFDLAKTEGFAAIILEVKLPLLDGYSVASLLRAHGIATPILILTAGIRSRT
ncbi:MAG: transcriptional regulator [Edaphobacter sp.]|nr:transcriptional regulator [Edaphobacter sp.]